MDLRAVNRARQQFGGARRGAGAGIKQRNLDLTARERVVDRRQISDDDTEKRKPHARLDDGECARKGRDRSQVSIAEGEKCFAATVQQKRKVEWRILRNQVRAASVLQQGKAK